MRTFTCLLLIGILTACTEGERSSTSAASSPEPHPAQVLPRAPSTDLTSQRETIQAFAAEVERLEVLLDLCQHPTTMGADPATSIESLRLLSELFEIESRINEFRHETVLQHHALEADFHPPLSPQMCWSICISLARSATPQISTGGGRSHLFQSV